MQLPLDANAYHTLPEGWMPASRYPVLRPQHGPSITPTDLKVDKASWK